MTKRNRGFLKIVEFVATDSSQHHFFPLPEDRLTASVKVRSICIMSPSFVVNCILPEIILKVVYFNFTIGKKKLNK